MRRILAHCLLLFCAVASLSAQRLLPALPPYRCVHYERNVLQFPAGHEAQDRFYAKMDKMLLFGMNKVNIWHVGGSHVQADYFTHRMRTNMSLMQPSILGVRGVLFPYGIAHTNYNHNYLLRYDGKWEAYRNVSRKSEPYCLGLTGMAAVTSDSTALLNLNLKVDEYPTWQFNRLRVLGYSPTGGAYPYVICGTDTLQPVIEPDSVSYVFPTATLQDSAVIRFHIPEHEAFVLTGIIPDNTLRGVSYYSSGVNGASLPSWLRCRRLEQELQLIRPDMVVLGIGINDAAMSTTSFKKEEFKANYRALITQIKAVSPDCALLFITNNDCYRYVRRRRMDWNGNGPVVQAAFHELAAEYGGAVWDLYDIMGGKEGSTRWREEGLMRRDRIHFTLDGYQLLGDMLYNALVNDYLLKK